MATAFSWRRGLTHAVLPVAAITIGGAALAGASGGNSYELGRSLGQLLLPVFGLALLISWLAQTGRATAAWTFGIGVPAVLAAGVVVWLAVGGRTVPPLTNAERAPLVREMIAGEPRLHHVALKLSIRDPGPGFVVAPTEPETIDPEHTQSYQLVAASPRSVLLLVIAKGAGSTSTELRKFLDGVVTGYSDTIVHAGRPRPAKTRDELTWNAERHDARIDVAGMELAAYAVHPALAPPFVVAILAVGDLASLEPVLTSFKLD